MSGGSRRFPTSAVRRCVDVVDVLVSPGSRQRCSTTTATAVRRGMSSSSSFFGRTRDMCDSRRLFESRMKMMMTMHGAPVSSLSSSSSSPRRWLSTTETAGTTSGTAGTEDEATSEATSNSNPSPDKEEAERDPRREETLEAELKTLKDQLLRSYAEQENTRTIAKRDVVEARQYAIKSFAKSLLEVADNLQRALDSVNAQDVGSSPQLQTLYEGIQMTNVGLLKALSSNGVKKYCEVPGDKFDPSLHSALMQYPDPDKEPGTVGQVITVGFTLNDRVLRPAEVGVVKNA